MEEKVKFSNLNQKIQLLRATTPALVFSTQNPDQETDEQMIGQQNKYLSLSSNLQFKLNYFLTSQKIQSIGQKYSFELLRLANITRLIREYYFGEVHLEDFGREIEKRMSVSLLTAQEIARQIKTEIIDWDPWAEYLAKLPKATVREILSKYPNVGDQEISSSDIELKSHPDDSFAPSIRNWVNDYILHLGQVKHGTIDRTKYLFHSENTKDLSSPEREKLGVILKSFDENMPLPVDVENNEVIFEINELQRPSQSSASLSKVRPSIQGQTLKPPQESFIRPYPRQETKPLNQPRPIKNKIPNTRYPIPDTNKLRFTNPYPSPGTHEVSQQKEIIENESGSPLVVKGMTSRQNISRSEPTPEQFIHPKREIIDPISYIPPEPRIEGNVVDLSDKND